MQIPWLTRPPTAEEVAAHAKAYPILGNDGVWLYVPPRHAILGPMRPQLRLLHATAGAVWTTGNRAEEELDARWLPCTTDGIPVCFVDRERRFAPVYLDDERSPKDPCGSQRGRGA